MKKIIILFLTIAVILTSTQVFAADEGGFIVIMDTVIARPLGLVSLAIGSAFFVVALPFAAISKSTKKTADTLVVAPFRYTFTRPLGDFDDPYMDNSHTDNQKKES